MLSAQKRDVWKLILLFFVPAMFVWLTTMVIPFLYGIWISFVQWDGIGNNYEFIGLQNYIKIFSNAKFLQSLGRTAIYTIGTVALSNVLGIALGLLLTSALKGRNLFRTAIFVPNVIGGVAMGYIWKYIFNYGFTAIGISLGIQALSTSMLSDPTKAMIALIIVSSWQLSAYLMILRGRLYQRARGAGGGRARGRRQLLVGAAQRASAHDPFLADDLPVLGHRALVHGL